ncbi:hypothetical protein [Sediminicola luteus]|uniref:SMODS and SLOG-associating 2TM effector domain-containing protein n=1 Tax=Sediminicola luteus TaxID=319238 RepID=A0A2A4G6T3_9FLAO|nr:hypothetical protein [Sediminicola luteus]PCE64143.1 hypothetical protein B7P33_13010 [Sediminicola luteus]
MKDKRKQRNINLDTDKYELETLELIYSEANERLSQTFISFRANRNTSFIAIGIYFSILSFSANELVDMEYAKSDILYLLLALSMIISFAVLYKNILPAGMTVPGCEPKKLIHRHYEQFSEKNQLKQYYKIRLIDLNEGILKNTNEVHKGSKRLRLSISLAVVLVTLALFIYLLLFI